MASHLYEKLAEEVKFNGDMESFCEGFDEERKEHKELSDVTIAQLVKDHLSMDNEYYEEDEEDTGHENKKIWTKKKH